MSADGNALTVDDILAPSQNVDAVETRTRKVGFQPGFDPRRGRSGGRPRKLRDIERMLNKEHRNLDKMTEVFARLRALALGEVILIPHVTADGTELTVQAKLVADPAFMKLYLDRLLGPAKANDDEMDLSDAPTEVIEYLRIKVSR